MMISARQFREKIKSPYLPMAMLNLWRIALWPLLTGWSSFIPSRPEHIVNLSFQSLKVLTYPGVEPGKEEEEGEDDDADGGEGDQAHHPLPVKGDGVTREGINIPWFFHLSRSLRFKWFFQSFLEICQKVKVIFLEIHGIFARIQRNVIEMFWEKESANFLHVSNCKFECEQNKLGFSSRFIFLVQFCAGGLTI